MADVKDYRDAASGSSWRIGLHHDEGDGTYSQAVASHLRGWDGTDAAWYRLPVDHTTGALKVYTVTGSETVSVSGTVLVSLSGTNLVSLSGTVTTSEAGTIAVTGNVSSGSSDTGSPVKVGVVFNSTRPTVATGQRVDLQADSRGHLNVALYDAAGANRAAVQTVGDGLSAQVGAHVNAGLLAINSGASYDVVRANNSDGVTKGILNVQPMLWDGTSYQRSRGTSAGAAQVSVSGTVVEKKDSGRTQVTLYVDQVAGVTSEAAASMSQTRGNASVAASTTYVVSAGTTLRIENVSSAVKTTAATACNSRWRVRIGANTTTGPPVILLETSTPTNVVSSTGVDDAPIPDGLEFAAGTSLSLSHIESHTSSTSSICLVGYEY